MARPRMGRLGRYAEEEEEPSRDEEADDEGLSGNVNMCLQYHREEGGTPSMRELLLTPRNSGPLNEEQGRRMSRGSENRSAPLPTGMVSATLLLSELGALFP